MGAPPRRALPHARPLPAGAAAPAPTGGAARRALARPPGGAARAGPAPVAAAAGRAHGHRLDGAQARLPAPSGDPHRRRATPHSTLRALSLETDPGHETGLVLAEHRR